MGKEELEDPWRGPHPMSDETQAYWTNLEKEYAEAESEYERDLIWTIKALHFKPELFDAPGPEFSEENAPRRTTNHPAH